MKLREYDYSLNDKLDEFDTWVTPSLGELKDFVEITQIVEGLKRGFENLSVYTENFKDVEACSGKSIAKSITEKADVNSDDFADTIYAVINAILLSTGKTDNNLKCQFPLYLIRKYGVQSTPKGKKNKPLPRTIAIENYIALLIENKENQLFFSLLLEAYFQLLLSDTQYCSMLQTLGTSYITAKKNNCENNLLIPLAVFQSRGSLTAKGGHEPENIVRHYLYDWGLEGDYDYNMEDIDIYSLLGIDRPQEEKVRKFDFVIPYKSKTSGNKLFIQSQYYAGDSGSVSHKVVDQTDTSRRHTLGFYKEALFVELLDGAGYYSSLNGDLKKMLNKESTFDFFQLRTAPIKLRRRLQGIDFLTALEIEHCILKGINTNDSITEYLRTEGYTEEEIVRCINKCISDGKILVILDHLGIIDARYDLAVKYALLDCISIFGNIIVQDIENKGFYYVPGFGNNWGIKQTELISKFKSEFPTVNADSEYIISQLQWLIDNHFVILR